MKNLPRIFMFSFLCLHLSLFSQQLSPSVISTSGGFYSTGAGMLSFTTGELAAIETYTNTGSILTQGFQQPWDLGTYIDEHPFSDFSYGLFPNPSNGQFYVLTESELDLRMTLSITDLLGKRWTIKTFQQLSKINVEWMDVIELPGGPYFLSLFVTENGTGHEYIFNQKITIVK